MLRSLRAAAGIRRAGCRCYKQAASGKEEGTALLAPVSRIGLHRRGVERVNCGPKLLDLGERAFISSYNALRSVRRL